MSLRFLITTVAQTARPDRPVHDVNDSFMSSGDVNESFTSSGRAAAPHPDTPEGAPR